MNNQKQILLSLLVVLPLLFSGCIKERITNSELPLNDQMVSLNLTIDADGGSATRGYSDTNALGPAEYAINRVRVYAFDGDVIDTYSYKEVSNISGFIQIEMDVKRSATKSLYVVINEPAALKSSLDGITSLRSLASLDYALSAHFNGVAGYAHDEGFGVERFDIPMTGDSGVFSTEVGNSISKAIAVTRSVARVDVLLKSLDATVPAIKVTSRSSLEVYNSRTKSTLFATAILPPATGSFINPTIASSAVDSPVVGWESTVRVFSFYVPERMYGTEKIGLELSNIYYDGRYISFARVYLGVVAAPKAIESELIKIERNKVYKVVCVVDKQGIIIDNIAIADWDDAYISGDVGGVSTIKVPNKVLMRFEDDTHGVGYTKTVNYKGSGEVSLFIGGTEVIYNSELASTNILTAGHPWLTAATWTKIGGSGGKEGTMTFTNRVVAGVNVPYVVELKSGSVTRLMSVEYAETLVP